MHRLVKLRERIDWIDSQIATLLNERMQAADQAGKIKHMLKHDIVDQAREKSILSQLERMVQHPILKANIANIYKEILQESKTAQKFFDHHHQPFKRIGVIGMGLIGGSICKGLKTKDPSIEIGSLTYQSAGSAMPSEGSALAHAGGWVDHLYPTVEDLINNAELIILASPISTIIPYAEKIKKHSNGAKKLTVIDVSSIKGVISASFEKLSGGSVNFIATHPMAGKEIGGFTNALATLFVNRPWVIVPDNQQPAAIEQIERFLLFLGANPVYLNAEIHDQQAALVSHLPSILAKLYFDFVQTVNPDSLQIAGPGFHSFTRLAHDSDELRTEISKYNSEIIKDYLAQWLAYLKK